MIKWWVIGLLLYAISGCSSLGGADRGMTKVDNAENVEVTNETVNEHIPPWLIVVLALAVPSPLDWLRKRYP